MSSGRVRYVVTFTRSAIVIAACSSMRRMCFQASSDWPAMSLGRLPLISRPGVPEVKSHRRFGGGFNCVAVGADLGGDIDIVDLVGHGHQSSVSHLSGQARVIGLFG